MPIVAKAIITQSLKIVTFLVENGANMNNRDSNGYSPFHKAVRSDNANIVQYFVQNGAELRAKNVDGCDALEVALNNKKHNGAKILLYKMF